MKGRVGKRKKLLVFFLFFFIFSLSKPQPITTLPGCTALCCIVLTMLCWCWCWCSVSDTVAALLLLCALALTCSAVQSRTRARQLRLQGPLSGVAALRRRWCNATVDWTTKSTNRSTTLVAVHTPTYIKSLLVVLSMSYGLYLRTSEVPDRLIDSLIRTNLLVRIYAWWFKLASRVFIHLEVWDHASKARM